ncbi:MAG: amidohydrolase family protein [Cyanobacteria bacterium RI_101]|nr:amidohydrolase family protein [Cyanobacteria bacterium RI_101]
MRKLFHSLLALAVLDAALSLPSGAQSARPLALFEREQKDRPCYDRQTQPQSAVTDLHLHPQPFGGKSIPYPQMMSYLDRADVRFALLYGIGQTLPYDGQCAYYLDCVGIPAQPGFKNDFENAANYVEYPQKDLHVALSMTFPDLARPEEIVAGIKLLDREYPGLFQWMGEVNLHKEALRGNGHEPADLGDIREWGPFMAVLAERGIPISIHADLGDDANPTRNLAQMSEVLRLYPQNKIVWMHMGLSRELTTMNPQEHIQLMSQFLDQNPNLYLDISWTVLAEAYFNTPEKRAQYAQFFNRYPDRILAGTDFVAAAQKTFEVYQKEANITGAILADVNDEAFRRIALGQNYFDLAPNLGQKFQAPSVCPAAGSQKL